MVTMPEDGMAMVVWAGAGMALIGVTLLVFSGWLAMRARRLSQTDPEAAKAGLSHALYWNLGALALGMLGLVVVIVGLILS